MAPLLITLAYLSGSIPFGFLLTRRFAKKDITTEGSGNIGATNVARVAGKKLGALVLLLDAAKGALPVWAALQVLPAQPVLHVAVGLAAVLGHVFPVWLRLKGGKGVATAMGVLLVLLPWSALAGLVTWALVVGVTRTSSVGSLSAGVVAVVAAIVQSAPPASVALAVTLLVLLGWTHRGNLGRLAKRTEHRF